MIFKDKEIKEIHDMFFKPTCDLNFIQIKEIYCYCYSCYYLGYCNTQDTICRIMANNYPFALSRKELNNLCYIPK